MNDSLDIHISKLRQELYTLKRNQSLSKSTEAEICDVLNDCICALKDIKYKDETSQKTAYVMNRIAPIITELTIHFSAEYDEKFT